MIHGTHSATRRGMHRQRRGAATMWVVLALPAFIVLLCVVVEVGNLWRARVELQNAMDAAALAAVKEWSDGGNTAKNRATSRSVGKAFAKANATSGQSVSIDENEDEGADANDNDSPAGNIVLGTVSQVGSELQFNASGSPGGAGDFGIRTQATVSVKRICPSLGGGSFTIQAQAVARVPASGSGSPQLVRVDKFLP